MTEQFPGEIQDQKQAKIYLEIGPWESPAIFGNEQQYTGGNVYIGLEQNQGDYKGPGTFSAQREVVGDRIKDENIILAEGDGRNMPFPDGSIHEIYMGNVLPAVPEEDIIPLLREAYRVIYGSGLLIVDIGDTIDTYFADEFYDDLTEYGFTHTATLSSNDSDNSAWRTVQKKWRTAWPGDNDSVVVIAHKTPITHIDTGPIQPPAESSANTSVKNEHMVESLEVFPVDPQNLNMPYGVPQEVVDNIVASLFDQLAEREIPIGSVLFGGYNGEIADSDATKLENQVTTAETPYYFLVGDAGLDETESSAINPVHFAGTGPQATIAVYDKALLASLDPEASLIDTYGTVRIRTTLARLNSAKVLDFRPRFQSNKR